MDKENGRQRRMGSCKSGHTPVLSGLFSSMVDSTLPFVFPEQHPTSLLGKQWYNSKCTLSGQKGLQEGGIYNYAIRKSSLMCTKEAG